MPIKTNKHPIYGIITITLMCLILVPRDAICGTYVAGAVYRDTDGGMAGVYLVLNKIEDHITVSACQGMNYVYVGQDMDVMGEETIGKRLNQIPIAGKSKLQWWTYNMGSPVVSFTNDGDDKPGFHTGQITVSMTGAISANNAEYYVRGVPHPVDTGAIKYVKPIVVTARQEEPWSERCKYDTRPPLIDW